MHDQLARRSLLPTLSSPERMPGGHIHRGPRSVNTPFAPSGPPVLIFFDSGAGYPYLYLMDPSMPVIWHEKFFAMRMAMSQAVRVNSRGVRFISADYSSVILRARQQQEKKGSNDEFGSIPADAVSGISGYCSSRLAVHVFASKAD